MKTFATISAGLATLAAILMAWPASAECGKDGAVNPCAADKAAADQTTMEAPPYEDDDPHTVPECGAAEVRKVMNEILNKNYGVTAAVFGKKLSVSDVRTTRTDWPRNGRSCAIRLNISLIADPKGTVIDSMNLTYTIQLNDAMDGSFVVTLDQR